ncbi:RNA 2',3'-cyclic phosphodiesterase [Microbulbifer thermotolerans]|uniref:RNA 2',3'-cyclic phosphodiesterase n=1 Tax=Microbulbifer thermotolerans TaxID=252514 RepID=A0A143HM02_MICTH|nr:RNA 2',3'-cyclic phosphodiesterase [Microbulbifer thermotolerans]AMX02744.1 hypothetical protein A3224_09245 [Microbulbifer thermotolerans]MCX2782565.1 RNA 2',3'-cyclic phosphodiesterase [Microbulbifer thermotolerans]MCX2831666.1 RNA 2',3'-cyclic phosphodiesterase [Microbulbifer thermotolerans]MCX2833927.1 RNA 2',3'-cyclic phosphodiesterase [Microbulbifer thermotolerans]WKT59215.1 RNA 2',3'-cyclic phosphodiesterase [Microbulbifer thermotolerans]
MQKKTKELDKGISRLFIGVRPDQDTQQRLDELVEQCRQQLGTKKCKQVRWTKPENRHLTLAFLGATPDKLIPLIREQLTQIGSYLPACCGQINSIASFPHPHSPGLAAELANNPDLQRMHETCRQLMLSLDMKPESAAFRPHFTLARSRNGFAELSPQVLNITVSLGNITLYKSHTSQAGSRYSSLFAIELEGSR